MAMFSSVLIANRGEIACRVIRTAKRLGMRTIAVYSDADADALFVHQADEAYRIGPAPARESYLLGSHIIEVAKHAGAECIHPGYGFLSENAEFAEACVKAGIAFVGPPAKAIRAMGLKDAAKALVERAGVPVVPGYHGAKQEPAFLRERASNIGFPVLIKAVAGGGGKGMRRVDRLIDFEEALLSAQREAANAFGDPRVLVEKYIKTPRHIEMQVFADGHGHAVHLFERDCSLQRRHQKVIEEAPAPGMTDEVRAAMGKAAVDAALAVGYVGAGTVEFIADAGKGLRPDGFFFMEMNTRLQVEHPVTEAITGLDLVELQLRVASGEKLPFAQSDLAIDGHAVEARLYAEDPEKGFLPSTGTLWALRFPEGQGLRIDTGVAEGDAVTPFYDPMIAKVIAHAPSRLAALDLLAQALGETVVAGPRTNVAFLKALCEARQFREGEFDTGFIDRNMDALGAVPRGIDAGAAAAGALALVREREAAARSSAISAGATGKGPWDVADAFQMSGLRRSGLALVVEGERVDAMLGWDEDGPSLDMIGDEAVGDGEREFTLVAGRRWHHRAVGRAADGGAALRSALRIARRGRWRGRREGADARQGRGGVRGRGRGGGKGPAHRHRRGDEDGARAGRAARRHRDGSRRRSRPAGARGRAARGHRRGGLGERIRRARLSTG